jgi:hypothetical protein
MPRPSAHWQQYRNPRGKASSIAKAFERINFDELCHIASSLNPGGCGCQVDKTQYAFGGVNIVFELNFQCGDTWIARLRFPKESPEAYKDMLLESEVVAMRYISSNTTIPVPMVYGHDSRHSNPVGLPYILMQAMPGKRLWGGGRTDFIPDQHKGKVYHQVADIITQLYQHPFDKIGMLCFKTQTTSDVKVGPIFDVAQRIKPYGPFSTAIHFYQKRAKLLNEYRQNTLNIDLDAATEYIIAPKDEPDAALVIVDTRYNHGQFRIAHPDFTINNFLFDDEYNITALLDWSGCQTVPMESFARIPERIVPDADQFLDVFDLPDQLRSTWKSYRKKFINILRELELHRLVITPISNMIESPRSHFAMCLDMYAMLNIPYSLPKKNFEKFRNVIEKPGSKEVETSANAIDEDR